MNHSVRIMNLAPLYEEVSKSFLLSTSRVIDLRPIALAKTENCKNNTTETSRQTSRLFSRKHVFYKVWEYRSVCTCRHTVAINILLRLANQISGKVVTNTLRLGAASISHPQRAAVPPLVGLVKSQQSAVPAVPLLSSQQQGAELKNIVWHLGARCWEQINLIRLELCAPDSPNLQHNNWGAESPQSRPSFTLVCYYHLLLPHRKTHGSAKHSDGASFG